MPVIFAREEYENWKGPFDKIIIVIIIIVIIVPIIIVTTTNTTTSLKLDKNACFQSIPSIHMAIMDANLIIV